MRVYHVELNEIDYFQAIDGLEQRAIAWEKTAHYHRTGESPVDMLVEECQSEHEAKKIATHYRSIIRKFHRASDKSQK